MTSSGTCGESTFVDVLHHDVRLALTLTPPALSGEGAVHIRLRESTRWVTLDAHELNIDSVVVDEVSAPFQQTNEKLCVELPELKPSGTRAVLHMQWRANPGSKPLHFSPNEMWVGYRASAWMPTRQDPAQRATLALHVDTESRLKIVASGRHVSTTASAANRSVHTFLLERPTPPFLFALAAGHFEEAQLQLDSITLRALGPQGSASKLEHVLQVTAPMYTFLLEHLQQPMPSSEYVQVFVQGDAAQEAAGFALLSADVLDEIVAEPSDDWIFSHELSHQWFAWLVPCADFADFWLNEGFATFLAGAVKERIWGRDAYNKEVELWRQRSIKVHEKGDDAPIALSMQGRGPSSAVTEATLQPGGITYSRGALVLHKLREQLGDAQFWRALRHYVESRAGQNARTDDLRRAFEHVSGHDLQHFFARWVYTAAPDL